MSIAEMDTKKALGLETLTARLAVLESRLAEVEEKQPEDRVSMVVFSGELDKVLAGFVIATGAAA
ncbi:MAG: hypothetical protein OES47_10610, partial [Acidobacteriota bacterium]|nr:hypothetical protein [Acidobacteriota bacterium]